MMHSRSVKLWLCVVWLASAMSAPAPIQLDIIDMAAISRMTPQQLERLAEGLAAEEIMRTKRSSAQALTSVVSKASSGLQSKVNLLGQASAGAATFISAASSKSGHEHEGYSYEPEHPKVDFWGLKKSILYTLFQAVKAITGGVTILKGQLIKGGGALASTLGKVISSKGDVVSNIGKKIVSSAALSEKKPSHPPVYGPPHTDYGPPTAYSAPTAPAHFTHTAPSAPSGFTAHKYPAHLDGRGKLNGVHAGVVILTPLNGNAVHEESLQTAHSGHTSLEPPPSIIHSVYSAVKNVFSPAPTSYISDEPYISHQPPPPEQPMPPFKPMTWEAVNSYGEPAQVDSFSDYDPRNPHPPFDYAASKLSKAPPTVPVYPKPGLTPEKIQKIRNNIKKVQAYMQNNNIQRSSEVLHLNTQFEEMLKKGQLSLFPTPVVSDNEIGVLPAELLPEPSPSTPTTTSSTMTATTTTTTAPTTLPPNTTTTEAVTSQRRKKDVKYLLRGNKIVQV